MAIIDDIKNKLGEIIYPRTLTKAVYETGTNKDLDELLNEKNDIVTDIVHKKKVFDVAGSYTFTAPNRATTLFVSGVGGGGGGGGGANDNGARGGETTFGSALSLTGGGGGYGHANKIGGQRGGKFASAGGTASGDVNGLGFGGGSLFAPSSLNGNGISYGGGGYSNAGGGGGGGAGVFNKEIKATAGEVFDVVIGKGGTGGSVGTDGADGMILIEWMEWSE